MSNKEDELIEDFSLFETWEEKYEYIIELGKKLPEMNANFKTAENKIKGCQSSVWLTASEKNNLIFFEGDSDSVIVKGLVSILVNVFSGQEADFILQHKLEFMEKIGLMKHLAQTRSNGLLAMVKQMKFYAMALNPSQKNKTI
jgi:cysteine desulfuration protein SufE